MTASFPVPKETEVHKETEVLKETAAQGDRGTQGGPVQGPMRSRVEPVPLD